MEVLKKICAELNEETAQIIAKIEPQILDKILKEIEYRTKKHDLHKDDILGFFLGELQILGYIKK
jgi:hypothetical protein